MVACLPQVSLTRPLPRELEWKPGLEVHLINGSVHWKVTLKVTDTEAHRTQSKVPHFAAGL